MHATTKNTHLRIDFVVREVCPDGSVADDDLRFIRFGDDVDKGSVRAFFDRVSTAMNLMFQPEGPQTLRFVNVSGNKIGLIKLLRSQTDLGLAEAKNLIEAPPGTSVMVLHDPDDVKRVVDEYRQLGTSCEVRAYHANDSVVRDPALPALRACAKR